MSIYQKKPYKVEAVQYTASLDAIEGIIRLGLSPLQVREGQDHRHRRPDEKSKSNNTIHDSAPQFIVVTLMAGESTSRIDLTHWIVKEPDGTYRVYPDKTFRETFIAVSS